MEKIALALTFALFLGATVNVSAMDTMNMYTNLINKQQESSFNEIKKHLSTEQIEQINIKKIKLEEMLTKRDQLCAQREILMKKIVQKVISPRISPEYIQPERTFLLQAFDVLKIDLKLLEQILELRQQEISELEIICNEFLK